jgi:hypothetical protein
VFAEFDRHGHSLPERPRRARTMKAGVEKAAAKAGVELASIAGF